MSLKRTGSLLAAWVLVLVASSPSTAEPPQGYVVGDMQLFASGEQATLGGGPRANEGAFFTMNGLYWTISAPEVATIGKPTPPGRLISWAPNLVNNPFFYDEQASTEDTGFLRSDFSGGSEITVGFVRGHEGIQFDYFYLHGVTQEQTDPWVRVFFASQPAGGINNILLIPGSPRGTQVFYPIEYALTTIRNQSKITGVGLDYIYRDHPGMAGGIFEWTFGAKYVEFYENFDFDAIGSIFDETHFSTWSYNRIVGPDIGLRWFRRSDRWTFSVMGDFVAGANFQSNRQRGELASLSGNQLGVAPQPVALRAMSFDYFDSQTEFSPIVQLKVELKWQATRAVAFNVGWSGMWMDNIARPSGMIKWQLNDGFGKSMGLLTDQNRQDVFIQGLMAGVEINR